jgi:hypothetical protein
MASHGSHAVRARVGAPIAMPPIATPYDDDEPGPPRLGVSQVAADCRLAALIAEHDDLDIAISVLLETANRDDLLITRLKKRKLQIKDEIASATP